MRLIFVRVICALGITLCVNDLAFAQSSYRQLTVNDFRGAPQNTGSDAVAHTKCTIDFKYYLADIRDGAYRLTFDVRVLMRPDRSWIDFRRVTTQAMLRRVLNHEQGHYNISCLEQQEILREASRMRFSQNYNYEARALFDRIHNKYQILNQNYDIDTRHMLDDKQQHSWDVYFQRRIMYAPPIAKAGY
ncbi:MAG TPA: hypothetical protein VIQ77_07035 [Mucilaginibacter sp.]|jgi:hypothetical protein